MTGNLGNGVKDLKQRDGMKFREAGPLSSLWQKAVSVFVTSKQGILRESQQVELGARYHGEDRRIKMKGFTPIL